MNKIKNTFIGAPLSIEKKLIICDIVNAAVFDGKIVTVVNADAGFTRRIEGAYPSWNSVNLVVHLDWWCIEFVPILCFQDDYIIKSSLPDGSNIEEIYNSHRSFCGGELARVPEGGDVRIPTLCSAINASSIVGKVIMLDYATSLSYNESEHVYDNTVEICGAYPIYGEYLDCENVVCVAAHGGNPDYACPRMFGKKNAIIRTYHPKEHAVTVLYDSH